MLTAVQMRPHSLFVSAKKRTRRARYKRKRRFGRNFAHACKAVSYTHLTLPTNREV